MIPTLARPFPHRGSRKALSLGPLLSGSFPAMLQDIYVGGMPTARLPVQGRNAGRELEARVRTH